MNINLPSDCSATPGNQPAANPGQDSIEEDPLKDIEVPQISGNAVWDLRDERALVDALAYAKTHGAQSETGFKTVVWNRVAKAVWYHGARLGGTKTPTKCKDHFQNVG